MIQTWSIFCKKWTFSSKQGNFLQINTPTGSSDNLQNQFFSKTKVAFMKEAGHIQVWFGVRKILQLLILTFSLDMSLIKIFLSDLNVNPKEWDILKFKIYVQTVKHTATQTITFLTVPITLQTEKNRLIQSDS